MTFLKYVAEIVVELIVIGAVCLAVGLVVVAAVFGAVQLFITVFGG